MIKSKKIGLFSPTLDGGVGLFITRLANGFLERGYRVDLLCIAQGGHHLSELSQGVRLVILNKPRAMQCTIDLVRYLRNERPDAFISNIYYTNVIALIAYRLSGVKTRFVVVDHIALNYDIVGERRGAKKTILSCLMRYFYCAADAVVSVSYELAQELTRVVGIPRSRIRVIYNPVITDDIFIKSGEHITHPWYLSQDAPIIVGVGRLTPQKDFKLLIRAFALVRQHFYARLVILGEGECRKELENLVRDLGIEEDVDIHGYEANPYPYMKKSSVFVLSSAWEGLPTVLIEALALNIPIVSTDCKTGPREILGDGQFGILTTVGDHLELYRGILTALLKKKHAYIPQDIIKRFSVNQSVSEYLDLLNFNSK